MTIPLLYRYFRDPAHVEDLLINGNIYYPTASQFNDPFDFRPRRDINQPKKEIITWLEKENKGTLLNPQILIDEFLNQKHDEIIKEDMIKKCGILCLSETNNSILMWSHYADGHKGLCLEFNFNNSKFIPKNVIYSTKCPKIRFGIDNSNAFFQKHSDWSIEKEWRIVTPEKTKYQPFPKELVRSVIFGVETNEETKNDVKDWIKQAGLEIPTYQAKLNPEKFELDIDLCD